MLTMMRMDRIIQVIFTLFLCLRSNSICTIISKHEGITKKADAKAAFVLYTVPRIAFYRHGVLGKGSI